MSGKYVLTAFHARVIDRLIDKLGIKEFRAKDLLVKKEASLEAEEREAAKHLSGKRPRGSSIDGSYAADRVSGSPGDQKRARLRNRMANVVSRTGKEMCIERAQAMASFRESASTNGKYCVSVHFNYAGDEWSHIKEQVAPLKNVVSKLEIGGVFELTDELLESIASEYPQLRTLKFVLHDEMGNLLKGHGLKTLCSALPKLRVLLINFCSRIVSLDLEAPALEKLALLGLKRLESVSLTCPSLRRLVLEVISSKRKVTGLASSVAALQSLSWLAVTYPFSDAELQSLSVSNPNLRGLCLRGLQVSETVLRRFLSVVLRTVTTLDISIPTLSDALLSLIARSAPKLERLFLYRTVLSTAGVRSLLQEATNLRHLLIESEELHKLVVHSAKLRVLQIVRCTAVQSLDVSCPSLSALSITNCPALVPSAVRWGNTRHPLKECNIVDCPIVDTPADPRTEESYDIGLPPKL